MTITVNNQQPGMLNSMYMDKLAAPFDPYGIIKDEIVAPLFTPLVQGQPCTIDVDGKAVSEKNIVDGFFSCSKDVVDVDAEEFVKELLSQSLVHYENALSVQDVYSVQAAKKLNILLPGPRVLYTPTDVITQAKLLLSGQAMPESFFATLAFYARIHAFGYYFANEQAFDAFKTWFDADVNAIAQLLPQETKDMCAQLMGLRLNHMTEGLVLRDDDSQNNGPYSFARLVVFELMRYEQHVRGNNMPPCTAGHMPFGFAENVCPKVLLLCNVEKHAHAHPNDLKREWDLIQGSMRMKPKVLSNKRIMSLTAFARNAQRMAAASAATKGAVMGRSATIRFRKTAPTSVDIAKAVARVYKHTSFVQTSENAVKNVKMTYQRPSRRDPDNPDRMGKTTKVVYKPDLHVYLDTSGSISERQYQDAIKACIKLAKKMGVNFYFNSFSDCMSQCTKLHVAGKTLREIYDVFRSVPKVTGGTDYEQIWHYINQSQKRRREMSLIISDFEYWPPNHYVEHPRFLYYAPISNTFWKSIVSNAKGFAKAMLAICPDIRRHILM